MILHSLFNLFTQKTEHPVAIRRNDIIYFNQFYSDVMSFIHQYKYNNFRAVLLCEDSYYFLVGFFGLLYLDSEIILTSHNQFNNLNISKQEYDIVVDDTTIKNIKKCNDLFIPIHTISLNPHKNCIHFFTSGSTGLPKRVTKNLLMLEKEIQLLSSIFKHHKGTVFSTVPHYHVYGFIFKILCSLISHRPFDTATYGLWETLLAQLTPHACIISSPAHLRRLTGITPLPETHIPTQIISAGAPLSYTHTQEIKVILGQLPTEIFGSTETGAIAMRLTTKDNEPWQPLNNIIVKQNHDNRMILLSEHVGDDWHITDDLIEIVPDGFHFLGRSDSIVKIEGKRVSLIGVENALCHLPWIHEAATMMLQSTTEYVAAVVVLTTEGQLQLTKLGKFRFGRLLHQALEKKLERIAMPRLWRFVDKIPTHNMGKRHTTELRALFENI